MTAIHRQPILIAAVTAILVLRATGQYDSAPPVVPPGGGSIAKNRL